MHFLQSQLWYHISKEIYHKPVFTVDFMGKKHRGITKIQHKLGKKFQRYMLHGVDAGDIAYFRPELKETLDKITRDYKQGFGDLFFQVGFVDVIHKDATKRLKNIEHIQKLKQQRLYQQSDMRQLYNLKPSWREHMPNATIVLDLQKTGEELKKSFSDSGKRYINKGKKAELDFVLAERKDWEKFREMRYATAFDKGFSIIPQKYFFELMERATGEGCIYLFLAKKNKHIVSGSVVLEWEGSLIYLYGATDRAYGNIGGHYRLTYEILKRGHKKRLKSYDLFGIAPPGFENGHHLSGVTRFKQAFGGKTISYLGNYDLIFNPVLYRAYKLWKEKKI